MGVRILCGGGGVERAVNNQALYIASQASHVTWVFSAVSCIHSHLPVGLIVP